ncbi:MAG: hypothetical protein MI862_15410 [Desulfobacterales bacterium]|nr:hypothetical protein [Desulfobacterales bacterium]
MPGPGPLIAIDVILLYILFGPLVLFALYVFFDSLSEQGDLSENQQSDHPAKKDPALWTGEEAVRYMDHL